MTSGQIFTPKKHRGGWICLSIGGVLLAIALLLANISRTQPVSAAQFWRILGAALAFIAAMVFLYRAAALFLLRFWFTRNGLKIRWGAATIRIPIDAIRAITPAPAMPVCTLLGITLPRWWLCRREGMWLFATGAASDSLVVKTAATEIYISPADTAAFVSAWEKRVPLGATQPWQSAIERRGLWAYPLWFDRLARVLGGAAILLTLILVGAVFARYPALPTAVRLSPGAGQSVAIIPRSQLLWIPYSGIIILLLNGLLGIFWYKKDRLATYLLWSLTIVVEIGLWVGFRMVVQ
ncbi:MAG TPA: hypothetical protein ENJ48_01155 [Anaerolineae bacterium]|nr:hypothetical protein [Anaerolineae bacterium]